MILLKLTYSQIKTYHLLNKNGNVILRNRRFKSVAVNKKYVNKMIKYGIASMIEIKLERNKERRI